MSTPANQPSKSPTSHLHAMNLVVALLAGVISITGGIYSLKNNLFAGPTYGSLQGIVRDERIARPLKLAAVEISDLTGAVVNTAVTDDDGHYLIESLKTGNYVVKFTAPIHKVETKTIKIEKDLTSSINVDLVPEAQQPSLPVVESAVRTTQNIPTAYVPQTTYQAASAATEYNASQSSSGSSMASPVYSQPEPVMDPSLAGPPRSGYRRHPHRSYTGDVSDTSSSNSQGSALAQAGTQLLQDLLTKKSGQNQSS